MITSLSTELRRFLVVGSTTVLLDFLCYTALISLGVDVPVAKALGFAFGMVFAWFANRLYTFCSAGGASRFVRFVLLYLTTLALNVLINQACLHVLGFSPIGVMIAFVIATGVSAASNFVGMKLLIFRETI